MNKIYNKWLGRKYRFKEWFFENITPHLPKIPVRKPDSPFPVDVCASCKTDIKIYAHNTGDGWYFFWDCENQHVSNFDYEPYLVGWFPFLFGWANGKDLERVGIEEI